MRDITIPLVVMLVLLTGCATGAAVSPDRPLSEQESKMLSAGIWDVATGKQVEESYFFERLEGARFILIGESHGVRAHHEVQEAIYRELSARNWGQVALGMEMIESRFQEGINGYLDGRLSEEEFLVAVEWETRWGVDPELYAPMWRLAKEAAQPVVGLNAPRELVREVRKQSLDGLSDEDRAQLPEIALEHEEHRAFLFEIFASHGMGDDQETIERFYQAQIVWDEAMAQRSFEVMNEREGQIVILAGRFHVERGFGIPERLIRRGAAPEEVLIISTVSAEMEDYHDLEFLQTHQIADFVWIQE